MITFGNRVSRTTLPKDFARCVMLLIQRSISTVQVKDVLEENVRPLEIEEAMREKEIDIITCGPLFQKWRQERRYWKISKSAIRFQVKYIDTGYHESAAATPTVISLHGSPGSYKDYNPLTAHLHRLGVRVIAPNFPGSETHPTMFRNTPEEKAEYINDFLQTLHVPRVDMLVCHSAAMFPGFFLSLGNRRFSPKSLVLLNPTAMDVPRRLQPPWFFHLLVRANEFSIGNIMIKSVAKFLVSETELKKGTFEEHFQKAVVAMNADIPKQAVHFQSLLDQNYPIMMAFSNNDKLISIKSLHKMAKMMVDLEEIQTYNKDGKRENSGGLNPFRKVIAFENGTHFLLKTYPGIVCEAVSSFLFHHLNNRVNIK